MSWWWLITTLNSFKVGLSNSLYLSDKRRIILDLLSVKLVIFLGCLNSHETSWTELALWVDTEVCTLRRHEGLSLVYPLGLSKQCLVFSKTLFEYCLFYYKTLAPCTSSLPVWWLISINRTLQRRTVTNTWCLNMRPHVQSVAILIPVFQDATDSWTDTLDVI